MMIKEKKLFNPNGDDDVTCRNIVGGNPTNLFNLNNVKYTWASNMYRLMMSNFWIPEKVSLSEDVNAYKILPDVEKRAYDGIFSFLVFLDSIQTTNLPNIAEYITAPEVSLILAIQTFQESIHSASYAYAIETIIDAEHRNEIYEFWRDDPVLFERIQYIAQMYQDFLDDRTTENFFRVLIANYLLEGLYFYNGFNFFFLLASRNVMSDTADIIKLIKRDELCHVNMFQNIINDYMKENPREDDFYVSTIKTMFDDAIEQEIAWTNHIIGNDILGITPETTATYTKYLATLRIMSITEYDWSVYGVSKNDNPYEHLEKMSDVEGDGSVKANFFESTVTSYNMSSAVSGWDLI